MQQYYWTWVTLREDGTGGIEARERNQKLECGCCAHCIGMSTVILNWPRSLWEGDEG
jgi:hypothetical protein